MLSIVRSLPLVAVLFLMASTTGCKEPDKSTLDSQLIDACSNASASYESIVLLLKEGADVHAVNQVGGTPLLLASQTHENYQVVIALIRAGADPHTSTTDGITPLMQAALYNKNPEVISKLLSLGSYVNQVNDKGVSALMFSCLEPSVEKVKLLLDAGADINAQSYRGVTPLMWAAMDNSNPAVVSELLKAGADPYVIDEQGKSALDYAKENPNIFETKAYYELKEASRGR